MTDDSKINERMAQHREHTETLRALERMTARAEKAEAALTKINGIRNSIVQRQTINWSQHIYPLVAALNDAGVVGDSYDQTREKAKAEIEAARVEINAGMVAGLAAERARADAAEQMLAEAIIVIREARAWIQPKNLDPEHHHYDERAVAFAARCDAALARTEPVAGRWVLATEVTAAFDRGAASMVRSLEDRAKIVEEVGAERDAALPEVERLRKQEGELNDALGVVPVEVHECGWQWRPTTTDTAFAPPFGTIRRCRGCGCLVAGGVAPVRSSPPSLPKDGDDPHHDVGPHD